MICFDCYVGLGEFYKSKECCLERGEHQSAWMWRAWSALHLCHSGPREENYAVPQSYSLRSLRHMDTISSYKSVQKILIHATGRWIGLELCIERKLKLRNYSSSRAAHLTFNIKIMLIRFLWKKVRREDHYRLCGWNVIHRDVIRVGVRKFNGHKRLSEEMMPHVASGLADKYGWKTVHTFFL